VNRSLGLRVERVVGIDALEQLVPVWSALLERSGLDPLCNGPAWVLSHARAFCPGDEAFALTFESGDELVGLATLKREPKRGALAARRLQFLADGSYDTDYQDVLCAPGREEAVATALLDALRKERGCSALLLSMVRADSTFLAALRTELERRGVPVRESRELAGAMDLGETFDDYVGSLKKRMRSKARQALRRGEEGELQWYAPTDALEPWLAELWDLHARRWERAGHAGSFADERRRAWYRDLLPREATAGTLALARLRRDGRTIAVQYGLLRATTYYQVQEGYDPELESERPGSQLRALMIRDLLERGVRRYDFMEGYTRHKADWGALEVDCRTLSCPLPGRALARLVFKAKNTVDRYRGASSS
jgi:CelD/BcsL family acetyltransferase involved in cellulose biosynthesis